MIVLAVDAATDRLAVAAGTPGGITAERTAEGARRHAGLLVDFADLVLDELGVGLDQVDALAVSDGPGSFTGLRVAAAWAKGVARARDLPVWVASSLMVRARAAAQHGLVVVGAGSAMRGEWYLGGYRFRDEGVDTLFEPSVVGPTAPPPNLGADVDVVVGDSVAAAVARRLGAGRVIEPPAGLPRAADLIALVGVPGGAWRPPDLSQWEPVYGRLAEAQAKWESEHGRALPDPAGPEG